MEPSNICEGNIDLVTKNNLPHERARHAFDLRSSYALDYQSVNRYEYIIDTVSSRYCCLARMVISNPSFMMSHVWIREGNTCNLGSSRSGEQSVITWLNSVVLRRSIRGGSARNCPNLSLSRVVLALFNVIHPF